MNPVKINPKPLPLNGSGTSEEIAKEMQFTVDNADVINMSLGNSVINLEETTKLETPFLQGLPMLEDDRVTILQQFHESEGEIPYQEFVQTTFAAITDIDFNTVCITLNQLHAAYGFVCEFIEYQNELDKCYELESLVDRDNPELQLQKKKVEKEIGDMCYYAYMLHNLTTPGTVKVSDIIVCESKQAAQEIIENIADLVKRRIFYRHDVDFSGLGYKLLPALKYFAYTVGKPLEYFILQNKTKLQKTFKQETSQQHFSCCGDCCCCR
jgi:hypothetical protein